MGILTNLFSNNGHSQRLAQAEQFIEQNAGSGLTKHYDAEGVCENVADFAGVQITREEAMRIVEKVRARHGWAPRSRETYFDEDEE